MLTEELFLRFFENLEKARIGELALVVIKVSGWLSRVKAFIHPNAFLSMIRPLSRLRLQRPIDREEPYCWISREKG